MTLSDDAVFVIFLYQVSCVLCLCVYVLNVYGSVGYIA